MDCSLTVMPVLLYVPMDPCLVVRTEQEVDIGCFFCFESQELVLLFMELRWQQFVMELQILCREYKTAVSAIFICKNFEFGFHFTGSNFSTSVCAWFEYFTLYITS